MSLRRKILIMVLVCVVAAAAIYATAYSRSRKALLSAPVSQQKSAVASVADGVYTVRIHSILTAGEDTTLTFSPVAYFEGDEASTTAAHDIDCPDDRPLEACAPTLTKKYYVRESGDTDFTAPVTKGTIIKLGDASAESVEGLRTLSRQFDPVFDVVIKNGNILSLTEKSPI